MYAEEYVKYDSMGLAALIKQTDVSADEVIEIAISQIEKLNPGLNAVITQMFDQARNAAKCGLPDGPLAGVPYLVKDLNTWVGGVPNTNGSQAYRNFIPPHDSVLVSRMKEAGLVILGKTNTPEFGLNMCTAPAAYGATPNPFDSQRSAGGSSGGSASAVAAGIVPSAHATDSGGSIRIPASNCGLFGLKPSRGRVPLGNDMAEGLAGFSTAHAVTHSVRDSALLLDLVAGSTSAAIYSAPDQTPSFLAAIDQPIAGLKVALCTEGFANEPIHYACQQAARKAAHLCREIGCEVVEVRPEIDGTGLRHAFDILFGASIRYLIKSIEAIRSGEKIEDLVEPITLALSESAKTHSAADYVGATQVTHQAARDLGEFFNDFDVLLTPTLANPPLVLGQVDMQGNDWAGYCDQLLNELPFTPLFNATGAPAASVPLGQDDNGLPVGVQIGASYGSEEVLLRLARSLELAVPWHNRI